MQAQGWGQGRAQRRCAGTGSVGRGQGGHACEPFCISGQGCTSEDSWQTTGGPGGPLWRPAKRLDQQAASRGTACPCMRTLPGPHSRQRASCTSAPGRSFHSLLAVNGENTVSCFYDKPEVEVPDALQRRRYVLKDPGPGPRLVLVQYKLPDPGAERRRRGPAARAATAAQPTGGAGQGDGDGAPAGEASASAAPAAKRQRQPAPAALSRRASGAARPHQQQTRRRQPEFVPAPGNLEDCFAAVVGLLEQAGVPDEVQEVR